jgi:hypothetical protein
MKRTRPEMQADRISSTFFWTGRRGTFVRGRLQSACRLKQLVLVFVMSSLKTIDWVSISTKIFWHKVRESVVYS